MKSLNGARMTLKAAVVAWSQRKRVQVLSGGGSWCDIAPMGKPLTGMSDLSAGVFNIRDAKFRLKPREQRGSR